MNSYGQYIEEDPYNPWAIKVPGITIAAIVGHVPGSTEAPGTRIMVRRWADFRELMRESPRGGRTWNDLAYAVYGFLVNGGTHCYMVECGEGDQRDLAAALDALTEAWVHADMVAAPGQTDLETYAALIEHCETQRDRLAILDGPAQPDDSHLAVMAGTADEASDGWRMPPASGFATLYTPWLHVSDPEGPPGASVLVPPSGHIAGIWTRNDNERGVWKAPANLPVRGALDLSRRFTEAEQAGFNPRGVNALRYLPDQGVVVWGARTLSPDPEWKYVNVRRLMATIEGSISIAAKRAAFEPNDEPLWASLRQNIGKFLFDLWRNGALLGRTPEEAFFVRCDRSTMTQADLDAGRGICLIGVAAIRPAEFIIFRMQWTTENMQ